MNRSLKIVRRMLCWVGLHNWAYAVLSTQRTCVRCRKHQRMHGDMMDWGGWWI